MLLFRLFRSEKLKLSPHSTNQQTITVALVCASKFCILDQWYQISPMLLCEDWTCIDYFFASVTMSQVNKK